MNIAGLRGKINTLFGGVSEDVLIALIVLLASLFSFGLGILVGKGGFGGSENVQSASAFEALGGSDVHNDTGIASPQHKVAPVKTVSAPAKQTPLPATTGAYVASKNGTRYYLPTCGSANRIKDENKIWFQTKAEAEAAGYTPAQNCPGL